MIRALTTLLLSLTLLTGYSQCTLPAPWGPSAAYAEFCGPVYFSTDSVMFKNVIAGYVLTALSNGNTYWSAPGSSSMDFLKITPANFSGNNYTHPSLAGKQPDIGFMVFTDEGTGALIKVNDGYTFDVLTGTITTIVGNYRIQIK